uniref:Uncharacterized protein n=1 Tax=Anguilla anguilla TaxID=7936 RepID=A0A0E9XPU9_ANGAN
MNELCGVITDSSIVCPGPYWYFDSDLQEPVLIEYRLSISGYKEVLFLSFFFKDRLCINEDSSGDVMKPSHQYHIIDCLVF